HAEFGEEHDEILRRKDFRTRQANPSGVTMVYNISRIADREAVMRRSIALALAAFFWTSPVLAVTGGRVWVEPFAVVGEQQPPQLQAQADWMNNALRQSVADDLASIPGITVATAPPTGAATTPPTEYVVSGTVQRVDGDVRVTGRIIDTSANKTVG